MSTGAPMLSVFVSGKPVRQFKPCHDEKGRFRAQHCWHDQEDGGRMCCTCKAAQEAEIARLAKEGLFIRIHGKPIALSDTIVPRFLSKVMMGTTPDDCWLWMGNKNRLGYGFIGKGKQGDGVIAAYRVSYAIFVGEVPDGYELDHLCNNPSCVNSQHLRPLPHRDNILRSSAPPAQNARKSCCPQGHPYDLMNTYYSRNGGRHCRACAREYQRRLRRARRAA